MNSAKVALSMPAQLTLGGGIPLDPSKAAKPGPKGDTFASHYPESLQRA
jgi:hypothetical protein